MGGGVGRRGGTPAGGSHWRRLARRGFTHRRLAYGRLLGRRRWRLRGWIGPLRLRRRVRGSRGIRRRRPAGGLAGGRLAASFGPSPALAGAGLTGALGRLLTLNARAGGLVRVLGRPAGLVVGLGGLRPRARQPSARRPSSAGGGPPASSPAWSQCRPRAASRPWPATPRRRERHRSGARRRWSRRRRRPPRAPAPGRRSAPGHACGGRTPARIRSARSGRRGPGRARRRATTSLQSAPTASAASAIVSRKSTGPAAIGSQAR